MYVRSIVPGVRTSQHAMKGAEDALVNNMAVGRGCMEQAPRQKLPDHMRVASTVAKIKLFSTFRFHREATFTGN